MKFLNNIRKYLKIEHSTLHSCKNLCKYTRKNLNKLCSNKRNNWELCALYMENWYHSDGKKLSRFDNNELIRQGCLCLESLVSDQTMNGSCSIRLTIGTSYYFQGPKNGINNGWKKCDCGKY
ncbi:hypothetical protein PIROE2DRAFT_12863 [Piromyces sp. E2]|nr:hypothetical protein PIROE2DRAFT_12863 [Piromyces sp. E2]|eukprot:OUM61191.1 hypothetical protein PIROE2DRAFT_12863 [Piromyces sp. E2]